MAKTRISNELMVEILLKTIDDLEKKNEKTAAGNGGIY